MIFHVFSVLCPARYPFCPPIVATTKDVYPKYYNNSNQSCTFVVCWAAQAVRAVLKVSEILRVVFMDKTNTKSLKIQLTQKFKTANFSFLAYCARVKSSCLGYLGYVTLTTTTLLLDHSNVHSHKGCIYALLYHTFRTLEKYIRTKVKEIFNGVLT